MKVHIDGKETTYVAIEASKRDPIRIGAAEEGVLADRAPVPQGPLVGRKPPPSTSQAIAS